MFGGYKNISRWFTVGYDLRFFYVCEGSGRLLADDVLGADFDLLDGAREGGGVGTGEADVVVCPAEHE